MAGVAEWAGRDVDEHVGVSRYSAKGYGRGANHPASLEVRKIYHTIEDKEAERHNFLRVVDESGEDYLYPAHYFMALSLSGDVEEALTNLPG